MDVLFKLVRSGHSVLLISLFATEEAIDKYGLRETIESLVKEYPDTFIYSDVWPYYRDVIAAMRKQNAKIKSGGKRSGYGKTDFLSVFF
jgi:hypothetical protein